MPPSLGGMAEDALQVKASSQSSGRSNLKQQTDP